MPACADRSTSWNAGGSVDPSSFGARVRRGAAASQCLSAFIEPSAAAATVGTAAARVPTRSRVIANGMVWISGLARWAGRWRRRLQRWGGACCPLRWRCGSQGKGRQRGVGGTAAQLVGGHEETEAAAAVRSGCGARCARRSALCRTEECVGAPSGGSGSSPEDGHGARRGDEGALDDEERLQGERRTPVVVGVVFRYATGVRFQRRSA
jgi:hypothetical protein